MLFICDTVAQLHSGPYAEKHSEALHRNEAPISSSQRRWGNGDWGKVVPSPAD